MECIPETIYIMNTTNTAATILEASKRLEELVLNKTKTEEELYFKAIQTLVVDNLNLISDKLEYEDTWNKFQDNGTTLLLRNYTIEQDVYVSNDADKILALLPNKCRIKAIVEAKNQISGHLANLGFAIKSCENNLELKKV